MPAMAPVGDLSNPIPGLDDRAREIQARARAFVEEVLMPLEEEAEARGGRLAEETIARVKAEAIEAGLAGGLHSPEAGGQGWTRTEWVLVEEQYGRSTNAINWHVPNAYNVWEHGSDAQIDRYLRPALRGEAKDAYAVTERDAGLGPLADRGDRDAERRRLPDQRREVVRHLGRRRDGARRDGEPRRRGRPSADAVRRRSRPPGCRGRR